MIVATTTAASNSIDNDKDDANHVRRRSRPEGERRAGELSSEPPQPKPPPRGSLPKRLLPPSLVLLAAAETLNRETASISLRLRAAGGGVAPAAAASFPPPASEWLDDIDADDDAGTTCGRFKCLFESLTNDRRDRNDDDGDGERYGYLVAQARVNKDLDIVLRAWEKAREISGKFGVGHLLLAAPKVFDDCPAPLGRALDEKFRGQTARVNKTRVAVQPIRLAPPGSYLFGCYRRKEKDATIKLEEFANVTAETTTRGHRASSSSSSEQRLREYEERLRFDWNATVAALRSDEGRCLGADFQVIVDPFAGRFYHLDFDRCFEGKATSRSRQPWREAGSCGRSIRRHVEGLLDARRGMKSEGGGQ